MAGSWEMNRPNAPWSGGPFDCRKTLSRVGAHRSAWLQEFCSFPHPVGPVHGLSVTSSLPQEQRWARWTARRACLAVTLAAASCLGRLSPVPK